MRSVPCHCATHFNSRRNSSTLKRWAAEFKRGRESIEDDAGSGRPVEASAPEIEKVAEVEAMVMSDRRLKIVEIAAAGGICGGTVHSILHDNLGMLKVSARWVPRNLNVQERHQ